MRLKRVKYTDEFSVIRADDPSCDGSDVGQCKGSEMKSKFGQVVVAAGVAFVVAFSARADVTIDPTKAEIVSPGGKAKSAATELQLHLRKITGVKVPIRGTATPGAYSFRLEPCTLGPNAEACEWEIGETNAVFRGNVSFAVIDFLEDSLGVRWPGEDIILAPEMNPLVVRETKGAFAPEMTIRLIRHPATFGNGEFARRMRKGRHNDPLYGHAFTKYWKRFGKDHPEYFAQRADGVRAPLGVKAADLADNIAVYLADSDAVGVCVSSTGFHAQVVADWVKAGKPEYINLCENDISGRDSCQCEACKALDAPIPPDADMKRCAFYADRYVWFGNEILKLARPHRPDVKVSYYAYNGTEDAPRRFRPDPDTVIGIVPTTFTYGAIDAYVGSWKEAGLNHFFYRPNRHHYYDMLVLPPGYEEHFFNVFQKLVKAGCIGFDYDAKGCGRQFMCWLDSYVLYHAMQDPSKSFDYWEDHYFSGFGPAAEDLKAYYRFWRNEVWNARIEPNLAKLTVDGKWHNVARGILWTLKDYYSPADFDRSAHFLVSAAVRPLTADQRKVVEKLVFSHEHARVFVEAVTQRSEANTRKLAAFRDAHGISRYSWAEQYYGDITGVEKMYGPQVNPEKLFIVSSSIETKEVAELLQAALEKIGGKKPVIRPNGVAAGHSFHFEPTSAGDDPAAFSWWMEGNVTHFKGNLRAAVRDYLEKGLGVTRGADGKPIYPVRRPLHFDALKGGGTSDFTGKDK